MSKLLGLAGGQVVGAAGIAAAGVAAVGLYAAGVFSPIPVPVAKPEPVAMIQPEAEDVVQPEPELSEVTEAETPDIETPDIEEMRDLPDPPSIDVFRLEPDGAMLVSGRAAKGWDTAILIDGIPFAAVKADGYGEFVEFLRLEASDAPRILSLRMTSPDDGTQIASLSEVIIAPRPRSEAAPATEPVTEDASPQVAAVVDADVTQPEPAGPDAAQPDTVEATQTVLLSDETGVTVLQTPSPVTPGPEVMSTVALDAITYNDAGEVELTGRGAGSGFVRVYLDNTPITSSRIEADGNWRMDLPEVDTGIYTLRVDEVDAAGKVTSRVETPFKREAEEVVIQVEEEVAQAPRVRAITVQPGSTLWAISRETYGEGLLYVRVYEANIDRIRDPDLIYPGQVFTLPE